MVAAAVIGGAVIGAAGSAAAGSMAAGATSAASQAAISEQQNALNQTAQLSAPYRQLGTDAIGQYEALLGIGPQGPGGILQALQQTPGYKFALSQGETGIENAASATGGVSGNTLEALDNFNQNTALGTYQTVLGDTAGAVQTGQAAAAGQAQNVSGTASNISNALINQGTNIANIDASTIAGITKAGATGTDQYLTMQALGALNQQPGGGGGGPPAATPYNATGDNAFFTPQ